MGRGGREERGEGRGKGKRLEGKRLGKEKGIGRGRGKEIGISE